jgi:hypothetical protein
LRAAGNVPLRSFSFGAVLGDPALQCRIPPHRPRSRIRPAGYHPAARTRDMLALKSAHPPPEKISGKIFWEIHPLFEIIRRSLIPCKFLNLLHNL